MKDKHRHAPPKNLEEEGMPLSELDSGEESVVVGLIGRGDFVKKANNMGVHVGVKIKKIQTFGKHLIVQVGDCKIGLGRRAAKKVIVDSGAGEQ